MTEPAGGGLRSPLTPQGRTKPAPIRRRVIGALAGAWTLAGATPSAWAQTAFPTHPVSLLVPFAPGGIADLTARAVAEALSQSLGQPVLVENRPSAGSIVATQAVLQARPDGHTLLLVSNSHAISASLFRKLPYDVLRDLAPIGTLGFFDLGLFVDAGSRHAGLREVLAEARARPGRLTIGCISIGSTQHLAAELLRTSAGIDALVVPYKASPAVLTALRSGEIDLAVEILGPMLPQVSGGALRVLAVSAEHRHPSLPAVPTAQEAGLPGYLVTSWNALAAPAATPRPVIEALNRAVRLAVDSPLVRERLGRSGVRLQAGTPEQMQALLASEISRWGAVIRAARIAPT